MERSRTIDLSRFASPFDNFFHYVPKEHETAVRHAVYNVLAFAALFVVVLGGYYVVVVLNPFIVPLIWATLTGFVLHPYKTALSTWVREALRRFTLSDTAAAASMLSLLLSSADSSCDFFGNCIFSNLKVIGVFLGVSGTGYFLYYFQSAVLVFLHNLFELDLSSLMEGVSFHHVATLWTSFVISLVFLYKQGNMLVLKTTSVLLWLLVAAYLLSCLWPPLVYLGAASMIGSTFYAMVTAAGKASVTAAAIDTPDSASATELSTPLMQRIFYSCKNLFMGSPVIEAQVEDDVASVSSTLESTDGGDHPDRIEEEVEEDEDAPDARQTMTNPALDAAKKAPKLISSTPTITVQQGVDTPSLDVIQPRAVMALKQQQNLNPSFSAAASGPTPVRATSFAKQERHHLGRSRRGHRTARQMRTTFFRTRLESTDIGPDESSLYIRTVFALCLLLQFYLHRSLLVLIPFPLSYFLLKKALHFFGLMPKISSLWESVKSWFKSREDVLVPTPVRFVMDRMCQAERQALSSLAGYVDPLVTVLLIFLLIIAVATIGAFVSFELYAESAHLVQTGRKVVFQATNSSVFKHLNDSIYDPGYQDGIDDVMESVYISGKEYISSTVKGFIGEGSRDKKATEEIELKVLELWDRLYQYWLSRKKSFVAACVGVCPPEGPSVSEDAISHSFEDLYEKVMEGFSYAAMGKFLQDNMGTLRAILEQTWNLLKGNLGLVFSLMLELLRLLASGGSGVANFFLGVIVYFTALFYLLAESAEAYKPIELFSAEGFVPEGFADALNKAVKSVFKITFKMAAFYGMYTYLTHTLFDVSVVMVPVLAAAFLAAVPVAGQYVVPLPAALELWLANGRFGAAILLVAFHTAPMMVVDATMYSEVKKGIHPWITGLSIVGGIYYFGVPGAIYGPLLLCGVFVLVSMYTGLLQELPQSAGVAVDKGGPVAAGTSKFQTPVIKRSESVY